MIFSLTCPRCGMSLKSNSLIATGQQVTCPECAKVFTVTQLPTAVPAGTVTNPAATNGDVGVGDFWSGKPGLMLALIVGGAVAALIVILVILGAALGWFGGR